MKNAIEKADPWNKTCQCIDRIDNQCRTQIWLHLLGQHIVHTRRRYFISF